MKTEVLVSKLRDCEELAAALDQEGAAFIRRHWRMEPEVALVNSFYSSPGLCWTIRVDGEMAGMFGCSGAGLVWLTTAPALERAQLRFIRQSGKYIALMLEEYEDLSCYAHQGNKALLRWLKWAGFEMVEEVGEFKRCVLRRPSP